MTIWVNGTSVSILGDGYIGYLRHAVENEPLINLSVGHQYSLMGLMRTMSVHNQISEGDTVIWEQSLLDVLHCTFYEYDELFGAMHLAWKEIIRRGARVVLLITPPRDFFSDVHPVEHDIAALAATVGIPIVDWLRYVDDRHPEHDPPTLTRLARMLVSAIAAARRSAQKPDALTFEDWQWVGLDDLLEANPHYKISTYENSLTGIEALTLEPSGKPLKLPRAARVMLIGLVRTRSGGMLWCGHNTCPIVECRQPSDPPLQFGIGSTRMPCVRSRVIQLAAAPDYALRLPAWNDLGQERKEAAMGPVSIFGMLLSR